jgi:heavy metal sensor kinase
MRTATKKAAMLRSIRWTLQLWHGVILLAALASFAAAMYVGVSRARMNAVDAELRGTASVVLGRMRPPGGGPLPEDGGPPGDRVRDGRPAPPGAPPPRRGGRPPRGADDPEFRGPPAGRDEFDELFNPDRPPPPRRGGPPAGRRPRDDAGRLTDLPADLIRRPGVAEEDQPYFVVWTNDGRMFQSALASGKSLPAKPETPAPPPAPPRGGAINDPNARFRSASGAREIVLRGPMNTCVLVGRSLRAEHAEQRALLWGLTGSGLVVLLISLAGGWLLSRRVLKPIATISDAARQISASDLSRRINVDDTKSELGSLAATLNETFDRVESAFKQQVRFTADASHELRTPLAVIHTQIELALSRERSPEEYRAAMQACLRAARRMRSLVDSLLVLARADAGRLELKRERFDLAESVEECTAMLAPLAQKRNVELSAATESPAEVVADRMRVTQVITNLMNNAIAYNRDGGRVRVSVGREDGVAVLTVADTGVGIAPGDQADVFARFFRADKARTREAGGSGLGLAICKSIVDAHGGDIRFASRPGEGTTFTVRLPAPNSSPAA